MSGAPVFDSARGVIVGVHYAGVGAVAVAIPLATQRLNQLLALWDAKASLLRSPARAD
jgi:hypothetical protein